MTPEDANALSESVKKRNEKYYAWIRHLILLASGSLTVLVALYTKQPVSGFSLFCMKAAWVSLGLGILLGSVCLHGEVKSAVEMARLMGEAVSSPRYGHTAIHVILPARYKACEYACYVSLVCAVVSLVLFGVAR